MVTFVFEIECLLTGVGYQSGTQLLPSNFGYDSELKFVFLMTKLTLNNPHDF